ncbi:MAG TPA: serine hydroxymethyltransferase [Candidatus Krumholzibacteria bacterium]|nr:serine hydroxymethyltransferase [Candidatus Krumholzibacteria bacterium]
MNDLLRILERSDPDLAGAIVREADRQHGTLEMIASENFVSLSVLAAMGSVMTNKYAEGYPGKRYYGGCEEVDHAENLARDRAKALFGAEHANVQAHSGSQANMAGYFAFLKPGDKIMGLALSHGGHLTHGHAVNFSGMFFQVAAYEVDAQTHTVNYAALREQALRERPGMLVVGGSAYARQWDFPAVRSICDEVGCLMMVDMAHFAGLVAAGVHPNPVPYADIVTSTTHKTLRGPRGGFVLTPAKHAEAVDKIVFPALQGGPFMHIIAAKAVCFQEAMSDAFRDYARQTVANARMLASRFTELGFNVVSGGTDTHLFLLDLSAQGLTGKKAEAALEAAGITVNKNTVPFDKKSPFVTSGIRVGTPALTTRGMREDEMRTIAGLMARVLNNISDEAAIAAVRAQTRALCDAFPLYPELRRA